MLCSGKASEIDTIDTEVCLATCTSAKRQL